MARWQRDPKARRNVVRLLAAVEVLAVTANFYPMFTGYLHWVNVRLGGGSLLSLNAEYGVAIAATAVFLAVAVVQAVMYARGRPWARWAFIGANAGLVLLGLVWFLKNRLWGATPDVYAALVGLALPMMTVFPLLWPLLALEPGAEGRSAASAGR